MYLLEELEERCFRYLVSTCTLTNICERLFGDPSCLYHTKITDALLEYMMGNYEAVTMSKEWEEIILNLKDCPQDLLEYRSKIILAISKLAIGSK
jgi:hypothetical protein